MHSRKRYKKELITELFDTYTVQLKRTCALANQFMTRMIIERERLLERECPQQISFAFLFLVFLILLVQTERVQPCCCTFCCAYSSEGLSMPPHPPSSFSSAMPFVQCLPPLLL